MLLLLKWTFVKLYNAFTISPFLATASLFFKPILEILDNQIDFFAILSVALIIDLVIGVIKYLKLSQFSFKKMLLGLITKVMVSYGGMLMFMLFASLDEGLMAQWFMLVAKFTVLLYPTGSAFANMFIVTNGKFPPVGFMRKLKSFEEFSGPSNDLMENRNDK